jgi:hypothetical protein
MAFVRIPCPVELTSGRFRGPVGSGAYRGSVKLRVAEAFQNGKGDICAPLKARIVLGAGTPTGSSSAHSGTPARTAAGLSPAPRSPASPSSPSSAARAPTPTLTRVAWRTSPKTPPTITA